MFINRIELRIVREKVKPYGARGIEFGRQITGPEDVFHLFSWLSERVQEEVYGLYLNTRNKIIGYALVSKGAIAQTAVVPVDVLRPAILSSAASVILIHNHPSGDPEPSLEDRQLTNHLSEACNLVGIRFLDHVVIGDGSYRSLKETGDFVENKKYS
jgi:DNA repair protein RadC